jgi:dipeptidyl aminopeptidase/acylaminoacyl peptidase
VYSGARVIFTLVVLGAVARASAHDPSAAPAIVAFNSADKTLHGLLYKPAGSGPFPAVLYNHGSAPGLINNGAFELIAPVFLAKGWVFFAPYRRGQGLSAEAGPYIGDEIASARARGGHTVAAETMVRVLSNEHLQDQMAALAWLRRQAFVRPTQIAVMGNSFGGIETAFGAAQDNYCAAADASGGAESWDNSPELQAAMTRAVQHSRSPILFFQAQNDYSVAPSRMLYAAMRAAGAQAEIRIYPAFGHSPEEGHSFAYRGVDVWKDDVLRFLSDHCQR